MLAFDESMAKASVASFDSGDPMAPLTWKVGEILMATHESLTMASGFNERLFTKVPYDDMDEVKVLMSRDSQSVVDDWAMESTPAMRKLTNLFHQTVKTLQDMQSADRHTSPSSTFLAPSSKAAVHGAILVPTTGLSDDAAKLVQRLQNEKAILMGQLSETSNMYTSIAEVVKEREDDAKRLKTLLHGKVDEITRLKQQLFVLNNEEAKRDEQERSVAHWKEKYMTLLNVHHVLEGTMRDAAKRANLAAKVQELTLRDVHTQVQLTETQALLSAAHDEMAEKAEESARRQSVQLHGVAHEYEHEIKDLKGKVKELKDQLGESQKLHKLALERQRTDMKKHFDSVLAAGHHGFTEHGEDRDVLTRGRNDSASLAASQSATALVPQNTAPQLNSCTSDVGLDTFDDDHCDDDSGENDGDDGGDIATSGPNISDDDDEEEKDDKVETANDGDDGDRNSPNEAKYPQPTQQVEVWHGAPRTRRQSIQEQHIHNQLSGMINKAFTEGSVAHAMASVVPPSEMLSSTVPRRKSITMTGPNGLPVQVEVPDGVVYDDAVVRLTQHASTGSRRTSMKGSVSSHDLSSTRPFEGRMSPQLGGAEAALDATMRAMDSTPANVDPELTQGDRIVQLQQRFDAEKAILKRKFIDAMCLFRQQIIDQYDKRAQELVKKHRAEVIRIATVAESKFGKLLDEKDDLLHEAKRTIKSLYKSLAVSSDAKTVEFSLMMTNQNKNHHDVSAVKQILKSTWSLVSAKRMSKRLVSIHQSELAELCKYLQHATDTPDVRPTSPTHATPLRSPSPQLPPEESSAPLQSKSPTPVSSTPVTSRTPTPLPLAPALNIPEITLSMPDVDILLPDPQPPPPQLRVFEARQLLPRRSVTYTTAEVPTVVVASGVVARPSMRNNSTQVGDAEWNPEHMGMDNSDDASSGQTTFSNYVLEGTGMYNPDPSRHHHHQGHHPNRLSPSFHHLPNNQAVQPLNDGGSSIVDSMLMLPRSLLSHQYNASNGMYTPPSVTKVPTRHAVHQLIENYANTLTSLRENINWNKWQCVLKCLGLKRMEDVLKVDMDTSATSDHALIRLRRRFATKRAAFSRTHETLQAQQQQAWTHCMDAFDIRGTSMVKTNDQFDSPNTSNASPLAMSPRNHLRGEFSPQTAPHLGAIASPTDLLQRCKTSSAVQTKGRQDPAAMAKRALTLASLVPTDISALSMDERQRYLLELNAYMLPREPTPPPPTTEGRTASTTKEPTAALPSSRRGKLQMQFDQPTQATTTIKGIPSQSPFMRRKALESLQKRMRHTKQQYADSTSGCGGGTALDQSVRRDQLLHSAPQPTNHHNVHLATFPRGEPTT
ncbi:hypothetical protein DYB25_000244 [Aphanomyces astaci]|uniref:Uncharacterized protein n=1 Tax=Aphanomyces astaci TaxID=112090 RepID=A0A397AWY2_APHAT|nr:hypothetical protein DYB36_003575 [Aphanomyces astaci]RHY12132.1 hypothetical protein DYB25_000244 [Aphanomyces astaci]RHY37880.1 hypothetical protein DYB38_003154 [Aphanomyces astaci]RHY41225.1 hypothetical protein DYB30_003157 [Aphanomyces astaci]RHZ16461.1 hypothetical protein DYB31_000320 [Aphanomyces astaci]